MKIEELYIRNIRGIVELEIKPKCKNFVIYGHNGTGKSAIVDAIDFLLTGEISRISGTGTGSLSIKQHGKHIDTPEDGESLVRALIRIENCPDLITLERHIEKPSKIIFDSKYSQFVTPILELAKHQHHLLSRREILNFITAVPKNRAEKITSLLNLSSLEDFRSNLQKIKNSKERNKSQKETILSSQKNDICSSIEKENFSDTDILEYVNKNRTSLGASSLDSLDIAQIDQDVFITQEIKDIDQSKAAVFSNFNTDLQLLNNISEIEKPNEQIVTCIQSIRNYYEKVNKEVEKEKLELKIQFWNLGISLISDNNECPFCGYVWPDREIKKIISEKVKKSQDIYDLFTVSNNSLQIIKKPKTT